jgi:hypothetical protein
LERKEVAPGDTVNVNLEWRPEGETDTFLQTATIWTNDPEMPKFDLAVEGPVFPFIILVPSHTWTVGMMPDGQSAQAKGALISQLAESFEITDINSTSEHIKLQPRPMTPEELEPYKGLSGYELACDVQPSVPVGPFKETISIATTLPEAPEIRFTIDGNRIGPLQIVGPGWTQFRHTVEMGRFDGAQGKKVLLSLFASAPGDPPLEFDEPVVSPPIIKAELRRDENFNAPGGRQRFVLTLEVPPGTEPIRVSGDTAVKVHLHANRENIGDTTIKVAFHAD